MRGSSPIWASEVSLARTLEKGAPFPCPSRLRRSLARSRETRFTRPNRRACSQAKGILTKPSLRFDRGGGWESLSTCHLHGTTGNSGWKIKWFAPFQVWKASEDMGCDGIVYSFLVYSADSILCSRASSPTTTNFVVLRRLRVVPIFPQG